MPDDVFLLTCSSSPSCFPYSFLLIFVSFDVRFASESFVFGEKLHPPYLERTVPKRAINNYSYWHDLVTVQREKENKNTNCFLFPLFFVFLAFSFAFFPSFLLLQPLFSLSSLSVSLCFFPRGILVSSLFSCLSFSPGTMPLLPLSPRSFTRHVSFSFFSLFFFLFDFFFLDVYLFSPPPFLFCSTSLLSDFFSSLPSVPHKHFS